MIHAMRLDKKLSSLALLTLLIPGCSVLNELVAFQKCEFSLHSMTDPVIGGIHAAEKESYSDFTFMEAQSLAAQLLKGTLPFSINMNVEVRNPGASTAAVNSIEWIAYINDVRVAAGEVEERVEVAASGGHAMVPIKVNTDMFDFLKGDTPRAMVTFVMGLYGVGDHPSELTLQIRPSVLVGGQSLNYPSYFTISKDFSSGD
jgi:hypothetical protein